MNFCKVCAIQNQDPTPPPPPLQPSYNSFSPAQGGASPAAIVLTDFTLTA